MLEPAGGIFLDRVRHVDHFGVEIGGVLSMMLRVGGGGDVVVGEGSVVMLSSCFYNM